MICLLVCLTRLSGLHKLYKVYVEDSCELLTEDVQKGAEICFKVL